MELIDRYLQAVEFWLPKQQKRDIIAELSEDIHSQIDEREVELAGKLSEAEVEAILKQRGRPLLVASRYLPQQYLIGPLLFPVYWFVLKVALLCCLAPRVLVWSALMILDSGYRAAQSSHAVTSLFGSLWLTAPMVAFIVTLIFAILERVQGDSRFLENWSPRKLPAVRNFNLIKRSSSLVELVVNLIVAAWWADNMSSPIVFDHLGLRISLSSVWLYFFWGILLLTLANGALAAVNLMRPYWTTRRAALRLLFDTAGSALFCWVLKASVVTGIALEGVPAEKADEIAHAVNSWLIFPGAVVVGIVIALVDAYRIVRLRAGEVQPAREPTMNTMVL